MTPTLRLLVPIQTLSDPVGLGGTEYPSSRPPWTGEDIAEWLYPDALVFAVLIVWRVECLIGVVRAAKLESEPSTMRVIKWSRHQWAIFPYRVHTLSASLLDSALCTTRGESPPAGNLVQSCVAERLVFHVYRHRRESPEAWMKALPEGIARASSFPARAPLHSCLCCRGYRCTTTFQ